MDKFHRDQYMTSAWILVISLAFCAFVPESRLPIFTTVVGAASGFMFGKYSNGFKRGPKE